MTQNNQLPTPQASNVTAFIDIKNSRPLLRYFQNVQLKFMQMDNFGLSVDDAGDIKKDKAIYLNNLFVAPHLSSRHLDSEHVIRTETQTNEQPDWQSITDILKQHSHSFVLGDPGTGKTTLIHWLMLAFSNSGSNLTKIALGELVPFALILRELPLREVNSFADLWQVFTSRNQDVMQAFEQYPEPYNVIETLLNSGQALILLDGLDEITHTETRRRLGQAVLEAMQRYPACRFLISSRVVGFDQRQWFGIEEQISIDEIARAKEKILIRDVSALLPVCYLAPFTYPQAQQFVSNWYQQYHPNQDGNLAQRVTELLTRIQKNDGLGRLSRIPVLLNMICFIHARRGRLPDGRAELYQRIAETYLVALDTARGISQCSDNELTFDFKDRSDWLSTIAYTMQESRSDDETAILISETKVRDILSDKLKDLDVPEEQIQAEISFLLKHFAERSGLFLPRGKNETGEEQYGFSHLSFLEYFAAKSLKPQLDLGEITWKKLRSKTAVIWWQETLVLFFEQLENAKLAEIYLDKLFSAIQRRKITKAQFITQLLLASIVMDSGVKLTLKKRTEFIARLWDFYLQIPFNHYFENRSALASRLWQPDFEAINLGLAAMQAVTELDLSGTDITDVSLLAGLIQLQSLRLIATPVSNIYALAELTQLKALDLDGTRVSDVSALEKLTQLQILWLNYTEVSDISALAGLTQLQSLWLIGTQVRDVSALVRLTQLQSLWLNETQVSDISALAGLTQLIGLHLDETPVSDVSALAGLTQLHELYLIGTQVSDVSALAGLTQLKIHR